MAKRELTWWTVEVTNDAGTSGDTYHPQAANPDDAKRIALEVSPDVYTVVSSIEPGAADGMGVVVDS